MKTKIKLIIIGLVVLSLVCYSFFFLDKPQQDFFEKNNIIDDAPIGKDIEGNWLYLTKDNQIIKSKIVYPTERGLQYKQLVEK